MIAEARCRTSRGLPATCGFFSAALAFLPGWSVANAEDFQDPGQSRSITEFAGSEQVQILGYQDHAMEPYLSRDGRWLLFNNLNQAPVNTNLLFAERVDDLTFVFRGEITGANTFALEGVPSLDRKGYLYFISTRSYTSSYATLYRGRFTAGTVTDVTLLADVSRGKPGQVMFDAEIAADGDLLFLVDGDFTRQPAPHSANIVIATRVGKRFVRAPQSAEWLASINTAALEYAPSISDDRLELFFTRWDVAGGGLPMIMHALRPREDAAFAPPQPVAAISGFVEAPSLTSDGRSLYYHQLVDDRFVIRRVTRAR